MDSLIKSYKDFAGKSQSIINDYRLKLQSIPDYSMFNDEQQKELREKFVSKLKQETLSKLKEIDTDLTISSKVIKNEIDSLSFPLTKNAIGTDDRLNISTLKARAENIALSNINYSILDYIKNEINNNQIDFVNHFRHAIRLNDNIDTEILTGLNEMFSDFDNKIDSEKLVLQHKALEVLKNENELFAQILDDESNPALKLEVGYAMNDYSKLCNEIERAAPYN